MIKRISKIAAVIPVLRVRDDISRREELIEMLKHTGNTANEVSYEIVAQEEEHDNKEGQQRVL